MKKEHDRLVDRGLAHPLLFKMDGEFRQWLGEKPDTVEGPFGIGCLMCYYAAVLAGDVGGSD